MLRSAPQGHRRHFSTTLYVTFFAVMLILAPKSPALGEHRTDEASLRAAVVLGILRYTGWNPTIGKNVDLNLCVLGSPESAQPLQLAVKKVQVKGKTATLNTLKKGNNNASDIALCHVLIYGPDADLPQQHKTQTLNSTLTICDGCKTSQHPTAITLIRRQDRIGFEVDLQQARTRGITFSSSLLELAAKVEGGSR